MVGEEKHRLKRERARGFEVPQVDQSGTQKIAFCGLLPRPSSKFVRFRECEKRYLWPPPPYEVSAATSPLQDGAELPGGGGVPKATAQTFCKAVSLFASGNANQPHMGHGAGDHHTAALRSRHRWLLQAEGYGKQLQYKMLPVQSHQTWCAIHDCDHAALLPRLNSHTWYCSHSFIPYFIHSVPRGATKTKLVHKQLGFKLGNPSKCTTNVGHMSFGANIVRSRSAELKLLVQWRMTTNPNTSTWFGRA